MCFRDRDRRSSSALPIRTRFDVSPQPILPFNELFVAVDVILDLYDAKTRLQGHIKIRLSIVNDGSLIARNSQQISLDLSRGTNTLAGSSVDSAFSISIQMPPAVVAQPIANVLDKLNHFMQIANEAAKVCI